MISLEYIEGIILRKLDYKESSKIIHVYTNNGLRSVLVHGSRNMKSPFLNLTRVMNHVGLHVSGKDLLTLRDGDVLDDYHIVKEDLEKFTYCLHVLELVYNFASHDHDHDKLMNFLVKIFNIVQSDSEYIPYLNMVEMKMLSLLGVNPLFNRCVACDRTSDLTFSIVEGGMCCPEHHHKGDVTVSKEAVRLMMELYYYDLQKPHKLDYSPEILRELRNVIDRYYEYHLNFRSNSRRMLTGLIGY